MGTHLGEESGNPSLGSEKKPLEAFILDSPRPHRPSNSSEIGVPHTSEGKAKNAFENLEIG